MRILGGAKSSFILIILFVVVFVLVGINLFWDKVQNVFQVFAPKPGSCLLLEEKYCQQVEFVPDPWQEGAHLAAFRLPKGTVIFSPADGDYSVTPRFYFLKEEGAEPSVYDGASVSFTENNGTTKVVFGLVYYVDQQIQPPPAVAKGKPLAQILDKPIDYFGDYNLIVSLNKGIVGEAIGRDYEGLKKLFGK